MSDLDDVNFPVTVANCVSPFGCYLNSIGVIQQQNDSSEVHCKPELLLSRSYCRSTAMWVINKNTKTFNSNFTGLPLWTRLQKKVSDHKLSSHVETYNHWHCEGRSRMCLKKVSLLVFARTSTLHGRTRQVLEIIFAICKSNSFVASVSPYNWL
jgi:hypothetical protein